MDSLSESPAKPARKKRLRKDPIPRFKPDISEQLDVIWGCPAAVVPQDHLARELKTLLQKLDVSALVARYSSQGRRGFHPLHMLGALVYSSLINIHSSMQMERALKTDHALRFIAGGHRVSAGRLRAFRRENGELFEAALGQTIKLAEQQGLIQTQQLAVDSVRLRAAASEKAVGTAKRATERLAELAKVDVTSLSEEARLIHDEKILKHSNVLRLCRERGRTSIVATSESAALMKFPSGGSAPGHRATVVASGVKERFVIDVFVDSDANDFGKLGPAVFRARKALQAAGVALEPVMQIAGDAGYFSSEDLAFASDNRSLVDVLIAEGRKPRKRAANGELIFDFDDFKATSDGYVCPAGNAMEGPFKDGGRQRWRGLGCSSCGLKPNCTSADRRSLVIDPHIVHGRDAMRERFAQPGARARYNQRIATVEPVFAHLEHVMGFRRVSSRKASAVTAEVFLKVLSYNLFRLVQAKRLRRVLMWVDLEATEELRLAA